MHIRTLVFTAANQSISPPLHVCAVQRCGVHQCQASPRAVASVEVTFAVQVEVSSSFLAGWDLFTVAKIIAAYCPAGFSCTDAATANTQLGLIAAVGGFIGLILAM